MFNINESHTFEGYWAFSTNTSCWFSGVLKYSPENQSIELRMWGPGEKSELDFYNDTIVGRTVNNKKISLLNCIIRVSNSHNVKKTKKEEIHHFVIHASEILIGEHYCRPSAIEFSDLRLQFENQLEFIQRNGFKHKFNSGNLHISYKNVEDAVFLKDEIRQIVIQFIGFPEGATHPHSSSAISQNEYFHITYKEKQHFDKMREEINFLKYFLSFSSNMQTDCVTVCFNTNKQSNTDFGVFFLGKNFNKKQNVYSGYNTNLIVLDDFNDHPELYNKWRKLCEIKESAIYKFFTTIYSGDNFLDERFHKLILAFEDYHRNSHQYPQKIKYNNKKTGREEEKDIHLRGRLESIFEGFSKPIFYIFDKTPKETERIIKLIKNTRDYFTHGGDVNKEKSVKDPNSYFMLTDLLIIFVSFMILRDLGFSDHNIEDRIWNLPHYVQLVDSDWSVVI